MKIVFRLNYHTTPGQSLWLKHSIGGTSVEQPMRWINDQQWELTIEGLTKEEPRLEYSYQLRQSFNSVALDEWLAPRSMALDPTAHDTVLLLDTWCSAGTEDYALETDAFLSVLPRCGPFQEIRDLDQADHLFQLRMAAVPAGMVPCLTGNVSALGNWDWLSSVPLKEVAANVWQVGIDLPVDREVLYKYGLYDVELKRAVSLELGANRNLSSRDYSTRQLTCVSDERFCRDVASLARGAGVALPVFSLRGENSLGVGEFADLKPLGDWATSVGLKLIQILPINDTTSNHDWRDSYPYSAISVFALHPLYLRISDLGYPMRPDFELELRALCDELNGLEQVDYEAVMEAKTRLTREIFDAHQGSIIASSAFQQFLGENREWVIPYAVFCVKRDFFGTADFSKWEEWSVFDPEQVRQSAEPGHPNWLQVAYFVWLQCELDHQLADAVKYLHEQGLSLKGDLPIGINRQSVDAWSAPHLFKMDAQAGAPPDAFAVKGQNWGFPTYHWEVMKLDGYAWWRSRFEQLSRYFDAYRIDHVLGFFRIWQVPYDQVEGIMGYFDPAVPIHINEIRSRGISFDHHRYSRPYIREHSLMERFGDAVEDAKSHYLDDLGGGVWQLKETVRNQRRITEVFATKPDDERNERIRVALLDCASDVLFFEVPGSDGTLFHPRLGLENTKSYQELDADERGRVKELADDYFYCRQEAFWQAEGYEKLPAMRHASSMLLCGEDLGMVPACVPGVLRELGILSLEIQRMPKTSQVEFLNPGDAQYMSVVSPSTHDMTTLRGWWREDYQAACRFAWRMFGMASPPRELSGEIAARIIGQHLHAPAMWAIFPLQDLLAMDEELRHPEPEAERINVPAIIPFYWRYRMHLTMGKLSASTAFNDRLGSMISAAGR